MLIRQNNFRRYCRNRGVELLCYNFVSSPAVRDCRSVELRALCNEVPRTPPGPEGSNGTGIASCAPDHPKFLAPKRKRSVIGDQRSVPTQIALILCGIFSSSLNPLGTIKLKTFLRRRVMRDSPLWKKGHELSGHCTQVASANI
jgi:hypothetical protein